MLKKIIMKNTTKLLLVILSSCFINIAAVQEPSQLIGEVHPMALRAFMETQADMVEMLTLFDLLWIHIKGGTISKDFEQYCLSLLTSFTILFDKHFSSTDKWNKAKPLIIAKQNELMPDKSITDLVRVPTGIFDVQVEQEKKEFVYAEISSIPPHKILKGLPPLGVIKILQSHPDMEELLTLYNIYWKYAETENPEFQKFCQYLKMAFNFLCDRYYSSLNDF